VQLGVTSIRLHAHAVDYSRIPWAAITCIWLQSLIEVIPDGKEYLPEIVGCLVDLCCLIVSNDCRERIELLCYPIDALAHTAISVNGSFSPYLRETMAMLQTISSHQGPFSHFIYWCISGMVGDSLFAVGKKKFRPHFGAAIEFVIQTLSMDHPSVRITAFHVLILFGHRYRGRMSCHLNRLLPLHFTSICRDESDGLTTGE
jgi:hypothetical protein